MFIRVRALFVVAAAASLLACESAPEGPMTDQEEFRVDIPVLSDTETSLGRDQLLQLLSDQIDALQLHLAETRHPALDDPGLIASLRGESPEIIVGVDGDPRLAEMIGKAYALRARIQELDEAR